MNDLVNFLKMLYDEALRVVIGSLFHSLVVYGINEEEEVLRRFCGVRKAVWLQRL